MEESNTGEITIQGKGQARLPVDNVCTWESKNEAGYRLIIANTDMMNAAVIKISGIPESGSVVLLANGEPVDEPNGIFTLHLGGPDRAIQAIGNFKGNQIKIYNISQFDNTLTIEVTER